jgi:hypothetical protein
MSDVQASEPSLPFLVPKKHRVGEPVVRGKLGQIVTLTRIIITRQLEILELGHDRRRYRVFGKDPYSARMSPPKKVQIYYYSLHCWPYQAADLISCH